MGFWLVVTSPASCCVIAKRWRRFRSADDSIRSRLTRSEFPNNDHESCCWLLFFSLLLLLSLNSTLRARSDVLFLIHRSTDRGCWVKTQNENHGKPDIEKERNRKKKTMYGTTLEICMEGSWLDIDCEHVLKWSIVSYRVSGPYRVGRRVTLSASEPATMTSPTLRCVASDWMTHLANEVSPSAIEGCGARVSLPSTPISIRCAHHAS